jgi:anti-anti-sigma factor
MQLIVAKKAPAVVLSIHGHLNASATPEFERIFNRHLDAGERRFVLNLAELTFISSAGLGSILAAAKKSGSGTGTWWFAPCKAKRLTCSRYPGLRPCFPFTLLRRRRSNRYDADRLPP